MALRKLEYSEARILQKIHPDIVVTHNIYKDDGDIFPDKEPIREFLLNVIYESDVNSSFVNYLCIDEDIYHKYFKDGYYHNGLDDDLDDEYENLIINNSNFDNTKLLKELIDEVKKINKKMGNRSRYVSSLTTNRVKIKKSHR